MLRDQGTSRNRGMMLTAGEEKKRLQKNVESRPFHQKTLRIKKDKPEKKEAAMSEKNVPKKIYIIDTNIFLHDPEVLLNLKDNYLVIPFTALDELDNFKKGLDELGANSRQVSRYLNKVRNGGDFKNGVTLESGGTLFIDTEDDIHSLSPLKNH
ncbi:MAG: PIN domain-containing protein, partial [Patescibacteria group bacterium]